MKINIKKLPEGYKIVDGKLVKQMSKGGATNKTLQPVPRDEANVEAEKNETVLTDADGDGVFEFYNIGGKRHSKGGTPLNLPEQSFIFSDTRKMLLTRDEMKELGIESKKRLTPAAASKKFPVNKYMDILKDESSDKIAITTAEAMIKKNKVKLSQLAFIQERKKDFEEGLPLAAYPYLLENGIDPREFEAKLQEQKQAAQGPPQEQGMPPQGPPPPGGQQMPPPEAMAQQGPPQGMPPGPPPGMPPQGGMPPMGPPQGGPPMPPPEVMQQMMAAQGQQGPPPGMMPPPGMAKYGGSALRQFIYGGDDMPKAQPGLEMPPVASDNTAVNFPNTPQSYIYDPTRFQLGPDGVPIPIGYGNINDYPSGVMYDADQRKIDEHGNIVDVNIYDKLLSGIGSGYDYLKDLIGLQEGGENKMDPKAIEHCKNNVCTYEQWRTAYRLKDIPQIRFMYESYLTKALDKTKAPDTDTEIMPGHENIEGAPYNKGWFGSFMNQMVPFTPSEIVGTQRKKGGQAGCSTCPKMQQGGQPDQSQMAMQSLYGLQQQLALRRQSIVADIENNPEKYQNNPALQNEVMKEIQKIDQDMQNLADQVTALSDKRFLSETTLSLSDFIPIDGETKKGQKQTVSSLMNFYNPMNHMGAQDIQNFARNGGAIPRMDNGGPYTRGVDYSSPYDKSLYYKGYDDDATTTGRYKGQGYYALNPYSGDVWDVNTYDPSGNVYAGHQKHVDFYDIITQENFDPVRKQWLQSYKDGISKFRGKTNSAGADISWIEGKSDDDLLQNFYSMNSQLQIFNAAGDKLDKWGSNYVELARKHGLPVMTKEQIKMWQGMYNSLNETKKLPAFEELFGNISTSLVGLDRGDGSHLSSTGEPQSDVDGFLGATSGGQFVSVVDPSITEDNPCPAAEITRISQGCISEGKIFDRTLGECGGCREKPGDPEIGEIPPYLTFPGDDQKVLFAAETMNEREIDYPTMEKYVPYMRDPGYIGPRKKIAASIAAANAMGDLDNSEYANIMGAAADNIDKAIDETAQANVKIFDNTQAYNVAKLNEAQLKNIGFKDEYEDQVSTALQNYRDTRVADRENLLEAQINRMDNADKLFELNLQKPNYYWDPQRHSMMFQNQAGLEAYQNTQGLGTTMSWEEAESACIASGFSAEDGANLIKCIQARMGQNQTPTANTPFAGNDNNNNENDNPSSRFGGSIRARDLLNSRKKLRNWILGIK